MEKFRNVNPEEVSFLEKLHESEYSVVFAVSVRDSKCVLKIHRFGIGMRINTHENEVRAYLRLKAAGLCEKGHIPQFYADLGEINPKLWPSPHLNMLLDEELPPHAILIEYIPNMEALSLQNYTEERMVRFIEIIEKIHAALVVHDDPCCRNMMIVPGDDESPERVLWLDFDRAFIYDEDTINVAQKEYIAEEGQLVHDMKEDLELDVQAGGEIKESFFYFFSNT